MVQHLGRTPCSFRSLATNELMEQRVYQTRINYVVRIAIVAVVQITGGANCALLLFELRR